MADSDPKSPPVLKPPGRGFAKLQLTLTSVSGVWLRLHHQDFGAIFFSRGMKSRWDAPGPFGAMCMATSLPGIVQERFGDQLRDNSKFLTDEETSGYRVTKLHITKAVMVADIRGPELFHINADAQLFSGAYEVSRLWSAAFMQHPQKPAGLLYNSRHDPKKTNLVLFDRRGVKRSLLELDHWALKDYPSFHPMLRVLRIGVAPPAVKPTEPRH